LSRKQLIVLSLPLPQLLDDAIALKLLLRELLTFKGTRYACQGIHSKKPIVWFYLRGLSRQGALNFRVPDSTILTFLQKLCNFFILFTQKLAKLALF
jgi:hypothetical protein